MNITAIGTHKITNWDTDLFKILDRHLHGMKERSILAITSKIVSICEGRVVKIGTKDKDELVRLEADYYIPQKESRYKVALTIKNGLMLPSAGIDESNTGGYFVLYPKNPQKTANTVRQYLKKRFGLNYVGVIITDSKTSPLRWGTTGVAIGYSGFVPLNDYIGKKDLFGRKLKVTKASVVDGLAVSAVVVMGEGREQTPLAVISDTPFVKFKKNDPSQKELEDLKISLADDLYAPILTRAPWKKKRLKNS